MKDAEFAASLTDSDYDFFIIPAVSFALAAILAAYKRLIHFDLSAEFGLVGFDHRGADTVAEVPRGLVSLDSQGALNLAGGHSLFRFANQNGSEEPCGKGQVGIVEDGVYGNAELVLA